MIAMNELAQEANACRAGTSKDEDFGSRHGRVLGMATRYERKAKE